MSKAKSNTLVSRRAVLGMSALLVAGAAGGWAVWSRPSFDGGALTVSDAHQAALDGDVILVDIRRPDEWQKTGVGEGAHPIDMRRHDFVAALDRVTGGNKNAPIALICARGVRSARLSNRLVEAGYTNIIDVPEGMLGSRAGPGWLESDLPTQAFRG